MNKDSPLIELSALLRFLLGHNALLVHACEESWIMILSTGFAVILNANNYIMSIVSEGQFWVEKSHCLSSNAFKYQMYITRFLLLDKKKL